MNIVKWMCPDCDATFISEDEKPLSWKEKEMVAVQQQHMLRCYVTIDADGKPYEDREEKPSGSNN